MAVDFNPLVHGGVADVIQQAQSKALEQDFNKEDPADIARKKLAKKVQIKKEQFKQSNVQKEAFSRDQQTNDKMQQILGGAAGPEAADALRDWEGNQNIQQKLTDAQKKMFREAMAKNPPRASKAARAMENLSRQPGFQEAVRGSQQMGTLQKGLIDNPKNEKAASEILKNRFMQSPKSDAQAKSRFMQFGMKQTGKGNLAAMKKAGDMLGTLSKGNIGRGGQRAAMNMAQRNPGDMKAMANVDGFVKDPNVSKLPTFARTKGTELLAKANGKREVGEGFKKLAGEGKFKAQTAQNKGRFFSTIGTGRPSEYRAITDSMLTSLQNPGFPNRAGQVGKFLSKVGKQIQKGGAKAVDGGAAIKQSKMSPMPKLVLVRMDSDNMDEEEMAQARSQNRANTMAYYNKLTRMYEGGEKKLRSAKFLEDVNKLQTLRPPENPDLSALTPEERAFVEERHASVLERHQSVLKLQRQRSRELRTKRRRGGKAGLRRAQGKQPRYFTPSATRRTSASSAFLQATGTGGRQPLPGTPQRGRLAAQQNAAAHGGDIQQQVASALAGMGGGPMTAQKAGEVAQTIAVQVAQQVAAQVTQSLIGSAEAGHFEVGPDSLSPSTQAPRQARPRAQQQGRVDGWGIPRSFERDLGGAQNQVVKPAGEQVGQTFAEAVAEKYTGKVLVKDPSSIREIGDLFRTNWKQLNKPEMALLKNLGWNQQMWDTKDTPAARWPGAMMTPFVSLMPVQREAVRKLGFTPHDWDAKVQAFASGKNA